MSSRDEPYTDEIDLIELLSVLWSGKWWILGITGAALTSAFSWLALTQPSYKSEAIITAPSLADYNDLYPGFLADQAPDLEEVLREVMNYMASPNQQRAFLEKHIEPKPQEDEALNRAVEALKVSENQSGDLQSASINLKYTAGDPEQAHTLVEGFIDKSNKEVIKRLARNANSRITNRVSSLEEQVETQKTAHNKNLQQQIAQLEGAEKRARAHGIEANQHNDSSSLLISNQLQAPNPDNESESSSTGATSFNSSILQEPFLEYGTRALSALIESRQQQLDQLPPETIQLQFRKESWENLEIETKGASALSVYQSASEGVPTRSSILIMALAGFLGLVLGTVIVLGHSAWKNATSGREQTQP